MKAQLIGENSAGMTAVEIYEADNLVWSHQYFSAGCTQAGYVSGLCQVWDDLADCADVADYEGGEVDDDGEPVLQNCATTTGVILEYDSDNRTWTAGEDARRMGQSEEVLDACMLAGLIPADAEHEDRADDDVVRAVAEHIRARLANR